MGTIVRAAAAYWFLLFTIRVIGRRAVNQMTPFELILLFLIGGMSIQAVIYDDRSLTNAFLAVVTVGMNHVLVAWLKQRFPAFRKIVDGTPVVVVENGHWHEDRLWNMRLQEQDLMSVARAQGLRHLDEIQTAIVERNGSISIYKREEPKRHGAAGDDRDNHELRRAGPEAPEEITHASTGTPERSAEKK